MRPSKKFSIIALGVLLLSTSCNQPVPTKTEGLLEGVSTVPALSTERWQIVQLPARHQYIAGIAGATGRGSMLVSCETQSDTLTASIILQEELSGNPSSRSVDLLLDEGGFVSPRWKPRNQVAGTPSAFDIVYDMDDYPDFDKAYYVYAHDFWILISNLEKHERVVAVVRKGRTEVSRYTFSLVGAETTIDAAVHRCGQQKP
ncbi:hypothetical protein [Dongia sedimenti]|uniref:Lipoprotein n=1 Tax=Dongia sedimenti TaxID=3064282 RepID=A0ABU0YHM4_9PROT|nr:hypothetical protein [Rhodospirillaceae bacterium R-7]